jgi:hypothetical protein
MEKLDASVKNGIVVENGGGAEVLICLIYLLTDSIVPDLDQEHPLTYTNKLAIANVILVFLDHYAQQYRHSHLGLSLSPT